METAIISVIIPVFNASKYLEKSLCSILNQEYSNLEIIVCDDASMDNSYAIMERLARRDNRVKLLRNPTNIGYLRTINRLFLNCNGDFIAFHDADDLSHSKRLSMQLTYLLENPNIFIVGSNYAVIDTTGKIVLERRVEDDPMRLGKLLKSVNPFQKPSILFRKEVISKIGGFREEFLHFKNISEDYDWLLRASDHFDLGNINFKEPLYFCRSVPDAMTKGFNNIEQLFGHKVAQFLHQERMQSGKDSIDRGDMGKIDDLIQELSIPYLKDRSLFHCERAEALMYSGLKKAACQHAWKALTKRLTISNLRLLQYCLRKWVIGI